MPSEVYPNRRLRRSTAERAPLDLGHARFTNRVAAVDEGYRLRRRAAQRARRGLVAAESAVDYLTSDFIT